MELLIDGERCDLAEGSLRVPGFDAARLADLGAAREGRRLELLLPATPANERRFAFGRDPEAAERFHDTLHTAELCCDGGRLMQGTARLLGASEAGYRVELRDGGAEWVRQAATLRLGELGIPYGRALTPATIRQSWTEEGLPVRFFPLQRDSYPDQSSGSDLLTACRTLSVDDYHPFLHVATLVEQLFAACGYTLRSDFFAGELFRSLYLSGAWTNRHRAGAEARMGFLAGRLGEVTATADYRGRVEADPSLTTHSVGNIVETATPQSVDAEGELRTELYNNGRCFAVEQGRICFRTVSASLPVGFAYTFRYTTDHRIRSREQLTGFDAVYIDGAGELRFTLPNRYTDRRPQLAAGRSYRAIVFDHAEGTSYRLLYTLNGVADRTWDHFAARSALVTTSSAGTVSDPRLQRLVGSTWVDYPGDWALYDGYIGETGRTTVEMRVTSPAELLDPAKPKYFDTICFFGAEPGQQLTLHKECTLRPRFGTGPGFGSWLTFADVAHRQVTGLQLLEGLAHLFNLRFRTDEARREVRIEPFDRFYDLDGEAVDWRGRIDRSQPVELTDTTTGRHEVRTWCYGAADGVTLRWEEEAGTTLGAWSHRTEGWAALLGEQTLRNPLFHPTLSAAADPVQAPSALQLVAGDREEPDTDEPASPRLVRYFGLQPLPAEERWSDAGAASYPLAAFHFAGSAALAPATLCFEDRDGAEGLHRFYDRQLRGEEQAGAITLTLRLAPHEFEALLTPGDEPFDLTSLFRLETPFGQTRALLRQIEPFDPTQGLVRCTFDRADR